jgi:predicted methyltransferase
MTTPLLTAKVHNALLAARSAGATTVECSLDLERSLTSVQLHADDWCWGGARYPFLDTCKDRTVYYWTGRAFEPAARFATSLIKLVPTEWGPPTFEIDGVKMLPTLHVSPFADAQQKVNLVSPRGRAVLDTCGGLGYFAACLLEQGAAHVRSFEKNPDVIWLRGLNPWSPPPDERVTLTQGDVAVEIERLPDRAFDVVLHDPPRFALAGELYSQAFYDQLARVIRRRGRLFHYTGTPNKLTTGRDVPKEVAARLRRAGFIPQIRGDGVLATKA